MKALTVRQPWASLIVHGHKTIETRTRRTNYRGRLYIHAGKWLPTADERLTLLDFANHVTRLLGYPWFSSAAPRRPMGGTAVPVHGHAGARSATCSPPG